MENMIEGFCGLKDYKLVSKRLKVADNFPASKLGNFLQFVKKNRMKRKSACLTFEVNFYIVNVDPIHR